MNKAFFSHSSANKDFVKETARELGLDSCIIDQYDFEAAYRTMDEIVDKLGRSTVFVFFITRDSLASSWCKDEVSKADVLMRNGKIRLFLPYIIESGISLDEIPEWIRKTECFNLKFFKSPLLLAKDIARKIQRLDADQHKRLKVNDELFLGRNEEIERFQTEHSLKRHACSLIVAGRPGCGRHRFSTRCIADVRTTRGYDAAKVVLDRESIQDLIWQLHQLTRLYSAEMIDDTLHGSDDEMTAVCAEMINELYRCNNRLEITDHFSVVDYRGDIATWFLNIIRHPSLDKRLGVNIISAVKPLSKYDRLAEDIITVRLTDLTNNDRRKILQGYLDAYEAEDYTDEDIEYFVGQLMQSPAQLRDTAYIIRTEGVGAARRAVADMQREGDSKILRLIDALGKDDRYKQILILLSQVEIASADDIRAIYSDCIPEVERCLDELVIRSLVSEFGPSGSLLRIDHAVSDYITRNKIKPSKDTRRRLKNFIEGIVNSPTESIAENPSRYLIRCREMLADGRFNLNELIVPSVAMRLVIKLYNTGGDYDKVERLCRQLLDDSLHIHLVDSFKEEVNFWLCLALIHQGKDDDFRHYVDLAENANRYFLLGFWCRKQDRPEQALEHYQKALKIQPGMKMARRELVDVLIKLRRYDDAFDLARKNYEHRRDNPYYVTSYFKCLIHRRNRTREESDTIDRLIHEIDKSRLPDREQHLEGMKLLYDIHVNRLGDKAQIIKRIYDLDKLYSGHKYLDGVLIECKRYLGL